MPSAMNPTFKINTHGGVYKSGSAIPEAMRLNIVNGYLNANPPQSMKQVALHWKVSVGAVHKYVAQFRATGGVAPQPRAGGRPEKLQAHHKRFLVRLIAKHSATYLDEMQLALTRQFNLRVSLSTLCRFCQRHQLRLKKLKIVPAERKKPHVRARRRDFERLQRTDARMRARNVVWVDETGVNNRECWRRRGRNKPGVDALSVQTYSRQRRSISVLAAIGGGRHGLMCWQTRTGAHKRVDFLFFLRHRLLPRMQRYRQSVIVLDNCSIHKGDEVKQLCAQYGVELEYLPAYSPYLNPIEEMFSKFKAMLRRHHHRVDICTEAAIDHALHFVGWREVNGWIKHSNYVA